MTRGSLTTFSIANDVAKYFAIIPALFMGLYPGLAKLNIMGLHSAESAIFSAIIYNAPDHHRIDTAGIEGSQIPRSLRREVAVQKPAGLWRGRHYCPVYLHKADRHASGIDRTVLKERMEEL